MLCWVDLPLFFCLSPLHVLVCSTNKCLFTLCHYSSYSLAVGWAPCGPAGTRCVPKMDFLSQRLLVGCASTPTALLHRAVNHAFTSDFFTHLWWKKRGDLSFYLFLPAAGGWSTRWALVLVLGSSKALVATANLLPSQVEVEAGEKSLSFSSI